MKISGRQHYLWRAVDQDGEVVDFSRRLGGMAMLQNDFLGGCYEVTVVNPEKS